MKKQLPMILTSAGLAVSVLLIILMNANAPEPYVMYNSDTIAYEKGRVTAVTDELLEPADGMPGRMLGIQRITVRLTGGAQEGQEIAVDNHLSYDHNVRVRAGQAVIVKADRPENVTPFYTLYSYDRTPGLWLTALVFVALMFLVGRLKGLRSALGLLISLFFISAFLLPAVYRGWSPVWTAILTSLAISVFSLLLLNGFNRKTLTAVAATAAGVLVSALFFFLISAFLHLTGYDISEAEELILISRHTGLQIGQVLFAGVLIASLGAVMDTAVSVAASLYEMKEARPDMTPQSLFRSGMTVGRDIIGANCQTLILAFVGSSLAMLLVLISYGTRLDQFLSSNYLAVEVVCGIAGSIAVILAVPITAGLCIVFDRCFQRRRWVTKPQTVVSISQPLARKARK
ncbi:MAG: YibE/F family protein [Clostridiales Family XIII bacterium]|jgi:uncharacterized membrane protein|nr:YibE/F family protein [Clostridiales Family XIII bacterium]